MISNSLSKLYIAYFMFYAFVWLFATDDKNKVAEDVVQCTFFKTKSPGIKYDILMKVTLSVIQSMLKRIHDTFGVRFRCNSSPKVKTKSPAPSSQSKKRLNSFLYEFNGQMKQFPRYYTLSLEVIVEVRVLVPEYSINSYLVAYAEFSKHIRYSLTLA